MKEEFLSYLWEYKLIQKELLHTTQGQELEIISPGTKNKNSGPDFSAAKIRIGNTIWAGNVELHINTSDWKNHNHHNDPAYSNIILHVVFNNDIPETNGSNSFPQPCLELKNYYDSRLFSNFQHLINSKNWVPCQNFIESVNNVIISSWLNRMLIERLERKSEEILHFLKYNNNNWDEVFYQFLARNFGFKINKTPFGLLAQKTPLNIITKHNDQLIQIEAILFGQSGLLNNSQTDIYPRTLIKEYEFIKNKYNLAPIDKKLWKQSKLRPANFPCIRLSQFAMLLYNRGKLFRDLINSETADEIINILKTHSSPYWAEHYNFDKQSAQKNKTLGLDSIQNIIINTIVPFMFVYGKERMDNRLVEKAIEIITKLAPEKNQITNNWIRLGLAPINAADSQALIELKKNYCVSKKCLHCAIGHCVIKGN
ncbi:MAG: DUF2851 family protein [Bacteroidetes bacterium]|nr:DUF2851 family protein [Bacteroidota bacterium]